MCGPVRSARRRQYPGEVRRAALVLDVGMVLLFVAIGRASHHHAQTVGGFVSTAWPFSVGLAAGWLVAGRRSPASPRGGALVCVCTVAVGMVLRVIAGQGTAVAFIIVALVFLGATMVGGRVLLHAGGRLRPSTSHR